MDGATGSKPFGLWICKVPKLDLKDKGLEKLRGPSRLVVIVVVRGTQVSVLLSVPNRLSGDGTYQYGPDYDYLLLCRYTRR